MMSGRKLVIAGRSPQPAQRTQTTPVRSGPDFFNTVDTPFRWVKLEPPPVVAVPYFSGPPHYNGWFVHGGLPAPAPGQYVHLIKSTGELQTAKILWLADPGRVYGRVVEGRWYAAISEVNTAKLDPKSWEAKLHRHLERVETALYRARVTNHVSSSGLITEVTELVLALRKHLKEK